MATRYRRTADATLTRRLGLILLLALAMLAGPVAAQTNSPTRVTGPEISALVRTTLIALHQANVTGNYSVLHDLGNRRFQASYSQAGLADLFRAFRTGRISLLPVVLFDAEMALPPKLTTDGLMRLTGHFPTTPEEVIFDIVFSFEDGVWRIDTLNVGMRPAQKAEQPAVMPAPAPVRRTAPPAGPTPPTPLIVLEGDVLGLR